MSLLPKQKQFLRGLAHKLNPVVIIGNAGLSESVIEEINLSIDHHELIKVRINAGDRAARQEIIDNITTSCHCQHVQTIGRVGIFYKPSLEKKIKLP